MNVQVLETVADFDSQRAFPAALIDTNQVFDRAVLAEHQWMPLRQRNVELFRTDR